MEQNTQEYIDRLFKAICEADRETANAIIDQWAEKNSYSSALVDILQPTLNDLGERWYRDEVVLAQAYVASKIAEDVLYKAFQNSDFPKTFLEEKNKRVVIGNIEDDYHSLGRKIISSFLEMNGWKVFDLGNDVLAKDFVEKAKEHNCNIIAVSAMMFSTAKNIKKVRDEIDSNGYKGVIQLAVGGAVFNLRPDLIDLVGGDGTAKNALEVTELLERLLKKSKPFGGKDE